MVGRVMATVKKQQGKEYRAALKQEKLDAEAARKARLQAELDALVAEQLARAADPKVKALEALRKTNREKALKTERVLAQRRRAVKALEVEEKLAHAAEAHVAKAKRARMSR